MLIEHTTPWTGMKYCSGPMSGVRPGAFLVTDSCFVPAGLQPCPGSTDGSCLYCQACPSGTYQEQTAEAACKSCPEGTTSNAGSSAAGQCLCKPGWVTRLLLCTGCDLVPDTEACNRTAFGAAGEAPTEVCTQPHTGHLPTFIFVSFVAADATA